MSDNGYEIGGIRFERGELFALGAAAGALATAAISEVIERRRRPATPWERAKAAGVEALDAVGEQARVTSGRAKDYAQQAGDFVQELIDTAPGAAKQTRKVTAKRRRQAGKEAASQAERLKEAAIGAIGAAAVAGLTNKVRGLADDAQTKSTSLKDQILEGYDTLRESAAEAKFGTRAQHAGESAVDTLRSAAGVAADVLRDYSETARERLADAELPDRARDYGTTLADLVKEYTDTARERIAEADLPDRAREYGTTLADLVKEYVDSASEKIREANLGDRARDYGTTVKGAVDTAREKIVDADLPDRAVTAATTAGATIAAYGVQAADATRRTARESAAKLSESATHLAQVTSEQAAEVRYGVQKGVKRTRRRARWGMRALIVGVVVGILTAPQSGQKTREALGAFVQNFLDVLMPDDSTA